MKTPEEQAYDAALVQLRKQLRTTLGGTAAEAAVGSTYQALVRTGQARQIRAKYRRGGLAKKVSR